MTEINSIDITDFTSVNSKMPYLDAFVMEISRLYPTVHATLRVMNRETTLWANGKPAVLKPGMIVFINYLHLHTSPKFWGPDAGAFVPERFLGGYNKEQPFMAFGYGPRSCVSILFSGAIELSKRLIPTGWLQIHHSRCQGLSCSTTQDLSSRRQGSRSPGEN